MRESRRVRRALCSAVVTLALAGVGLVAFADAGAANVPGLGPLDHYLCYPAKATSTAAPAFPQTPKAVWLQNQFASLLGQVAAVVQHCNPVQKTTPDGAVTPIHRPDVHLVCLTFDGNTHSVPPVVNVTNQFSPTTAAGGPTPVPLAVGPLRRVCLPSFKSLTAANLPPGPDAQPPAFDHYSCYAVKYVVPATGAKPVVFTPPNAAGGVTLDDQFADLTTPPTTVKAIIGAPSTLCLPTIKIVNPDPAAPPPTIANLVDAQDHLVCFAIRVTQPAGGFVPPSSVFDENQFGTGQVALRNPNQLCVPSLKAVPGTPGT
jgi:hypothetical protein